jgi:hypothetical protein
LPESNDEHVTSITSGPGGRNDVAEHRLLTRKAHRRSRQAIFDRIHSLRDAGNSVATIARETGFGSRTIRKWLKCDAPPERRGSAPKSPIVAASLYIKPRGLLTPNQAAKVDALKTASPEFTAMRRLAMRFRGILRSRDVEKFGLWLDDAQQSGIYAMRRFARAVRRDLDAVTNALTEEWSNGQTEGHINRLKTLKRAMYGRAGAELLRARMLPLHAAVQHGK